METVINVVESLVQKTNNVASTAETGAPQAGNSALYKCRSCNLVYIATEKQSCSSCGTPLEQVPATLDET